MDHWILDKNGEPKKASLDEWARMLNAGDHVVASTMLDNGIHVSTVLLGINHNSGPGEPVLWESLAFNASGSSMDETQRRYTTRKEALEGHEALVKELS